MQADDQKEMVLEIATNVLATEITDADFLVGHDETQPIATLLAKLLQVQETSTIDFTSKMWESVFWADENTRPDVVTSQLNQVYERSDESSKEAIRVNLNNSLMSLRDVRFNATTDNAINNSSDVSGSGKLSGSYLGVSMAAEGSARTDNKVAHSHSDSHSQSEWNKTASSSSKDDHSDQVKNAIHEATNYAKWDGKKFVVKPMNVSRINLAAFRGRTRGTTTQIRVQQAMSELSTSINVVDPADFLQNTRFCIGRDCLEAEDFQRILQLRNRLNSDSDGKICLGETCLTRHDFLRILELPDKLQTKKVVIRDEGGRNYDCIGRSCFPWEGKDLLSQFSAISTTSEQSCAGERCLVAEDFERVLHLRPGMSDHRGSSCARYGRAPQYTVKSNNYAVPFSTSLI